MRIPDPGPDLMRLLEEENEEYRNLANAFARSRGDDAKTPEPPN